MIKLDHVGREAIYYTSPYFSNIDLTGAYIKSVQWDQNGHEGTMTVDKNNNFYRIGLFPELYKGKKNLQNVTQKKLHSTARKITANLTIVKQGNFKLGYIYNLRQFV